MSSSTIPQFSYDHLQGEQYLNAQLRQQYAPFEMEESVFKSYFRFPPALAVQLIEELNCIQNTDNQAPMDDNSGENTLLFHTKCLIAFNFYATGACQKKVRSICPMSQKIIDKSIEEVTELLNKLMDKYIVFPTTEIERNRIAGEFAKKGIPGILGLIDCTHIPLTRLSNEDEQVYLNRDQFHSINTLIAVNDLNIITYINVRSPGSVDDNTVFRSSQLHAMLENEYTTPEAQKFWLLGNYEFWLTPFLMTPCFEETNEQEKEFNRRFYIIWPQIRKAINIFKNRFRCILGKKKLRYSPLKCGKIINAVAVCHNFLISNGYEDKFSAPDKPKSTYRRDNPYYAAGLQTVETITNNLIL